MEGIFKLFLDPSHIKLLILTLDISHFDKSGNEFNDEHQLNIKFISITLEIFHFDISGNEIKDSHS